MSVVWLIRLLRCVALHAAIRISCVVALAAADPIISEFMAANTKVLADDDGAYSDWIEIHNPGDTDLLLEGWFLTDSASNKKKWQFPPVSVPAGGYLIVFASSKDRLSPDGTLHTNFALSAGGEYLGLTRPDGVTVASEFSPSFPAQSDNVSYGRIILENGSVETGFLKTPTPNAPNGGLEALLLVETVAFSRSSGIFSNTLTIELSGAAAGQEIRYVTASGPGAADTVVTPESPVYSEPLTLSTTTLLKAAVFTSGGVLRGTTTSAHYLKATAELDSFQTKLPILVLDDLGAGQLIRDGVDHAAWAYGFAPKDNVAGIAGRSPDLISPLVATVRGASSAEFPKKGYNVKMRDALGGKRAVAFFDLPAYERWALVAPWAFDQNFINNSFVYELSNRLGRWAPRTRLAEMFFNNGGDDLDPSDYAGIYVVTDRIRVEKGRVDITELSASDVSTPAVTGGYILKIDAPDADEVSWRSDRGVPESEETAIVLVAPDAADIVPAQLDYIQGYVRRMENALHADRAGGWKQRTYLDYIDRASWVDHHILNVLASNPDGLHRSAYFTKPRGGKLQAGPVWDFDRALGSFWDERSSVVDTWSGVGSKVDFWRTGWWGVLAEDPEFVQEWVDRWQSLRASQLSTSALTNLAQSLADSVGTEAADRDVARWPDSASPYGSYAAQIDTLKSWLAQRAEWIDSQFVAKPSVATQGGSTTFTAAEGAQLIYTRDGTDPRLIGGEIAPDAVVTDEPLTVPASANVHVRSYHPTARGVPNSPWSAAVGTSGATAPGATSRIANLSSRAVAGEDRQAIAVAFSITDTESKRYLARAIGPGLAAFGTTDTAGDPQIRLQRVNGTEVQRNAGWQNSPDAAQIREAGKSVGAFQLEDDSPDSALIGDLPNGTYSIEIASAPGRPGVALAELYELDSNGRFANLSIRGRVTPGNPLVGGFVIQGSGRKRLLIRAVGPTLGELGFNETLADPILTLHSGSSPVASNDRWSEAENASAIEAARKLIGAFPLAAESEDAAVFVTVPPGAYTVEVKSKDETEGIALLEIYPIP